MNVLGMPNGMVTWRAAALVTSAVAAAPAAILVLRPGSRSIASALEVAEVVADVTVLVAAALVYLHWRVAVGRVAGWLTIVLVMIAVSGLVRAAVLRDHLSLVDLDHSVLLHLVLALVLMGVAADADQRDLRWDPALVGLALGVSLAAAQLAVEVYVRLHLPDAALILSRLALLLTVPATAALILRLTSLDDWVRARIALVAVLLSLGQLTTYLNLDVPAVRTVAIAADVIGASLLLATTIALLRVTIGAARDEIENLHDQLEEERAGVRVDRERLHEISSTIAGIASATRLMSAGSEISGQQRRRLEQMLQSEIARLERLTLVRAPLGPTAFGIDEVVSPLVLSHHARGHLIDWTPTDLVGFGMPDDLAEVVNILLENASRHGGGDATRVAVRLEGGRVEITVSDSGPGVPGADQHRIFEWGVRSQASTGQGIGLHIASTLMSKNGGSLALAPSIHRGATFVATITAAASTAAVPAIVTVPADTEQKEVVSHDVFSH